MFIDRLQINQKLKTLLAIVLSILLTNNKLKQLWLRQLDFTVTTKIIKYSYYNYKIKL